MDILVKDIVKELDAAHDKEHWRCAVLRDADNNPRCSDVCETQAKLLQMFYARSVPDPLDVPTDPAEHDGVALVCALDRFLEHDGVSITLATNRVWVMAPKEPYERIQMIATWGDGNAEVSKWFDGEGKARERYGSS